MTPSPGSTIQLSGPGPPSARSFPETPSTVFSLSGPFPPNSASEPGPPTSVSAPLPPWRLSLPPSSLSRPFPPINTSFPPRPSMMSFPLPPQITSAPGVPTRWSLLFVPVVVHDRPLALAISDGGVDRIRQVDEEVLVWLDLRVTVDGHGEVLTGVSREERDCPRRRQVVAISRRRRPVRGGEVDGDGLEARVRE